MKNKKQRKVPLRIQRQITEIDWGVVMSETLSEELKEKYPEAFDIWLKKHSGMKVTYSVGVRSYSESELSRMQLSETKEELRHSIKMLKRWKAKFQQKEVERCQPLKMTDFSCLS